MADQKQVRVLAWTLMKDHGLTGWSFGFNNAKQRFGVCDYRKKTIGMSRVLLPQLTMAQAENTILHEIAHALTPGDNHGPTWKATAKAIGSDGMRCGPVVKEVPHKWTLYCEAGHEFGRHRRFKGRASCPNCTNTFDERFLLSWRQNY